MTNNEKLQSKINYLNEMKEAREKYMITDFGKYLHETAKILKKYGDTGKTVVDHNSMYPPIKRDS